MKRSWLVLTTLVVAVVLIGGLAIALAHSPGRDTETWKDITESYVRQRGWVLGRQVTIEKAVKARKPDNFTQDMNFHTYGDAPHYYAVDETSGGYKSTHAVPYPAGDLATETPLSTYSPYSSTAGTTGGSYIGSRPIPYPPTEVWCVLLKLASEDTYFVVFANLHMDMYNAQWIVHEGEKAPFSQIFLDRVTSFGCDLDLSDLP
jgi:hypothetical protein